MTEVDLFISTKRVKVLMVDSQVQDPGLVSGIWGALLRFLQPTQARSPPPPGGHDGPCPADHLLHC